MVGMEYYVILYLVAKLPIVILTCVCAINNLFICILLTDAHQAELKMVVYKVNI